MGLRDIPGVGVSCSVDLKRFTLTPRTRQKSLLLGRGRQHQRAHFSTIVAGGLELLGVGLAHRSYAAAPSESGVGYQKAGLLSVAKEQGVFERRLKPLGVEAVKWSEFELGPPIMDAISAGTIDFGWVDDVPAIAAQSAGAKFVYAACMPASERGMLVPERSATRSLAEITGKKVAFARGTSGQSVLLKLLAKADLAYGDIVPVFLPPRDDSAALSRGDVDVWIIHHPYLALAERVQKERRHAPSFSTFAPNRRAVEPLLLRR
jgi:ABC-type nitrate/sulfonate/bicarbonate transport system substrate-binding protein